MGVCVRVSTTATRVSWQLGGHLLDRLPRGAHLATTHRGPFTALIENVSVDGGGANSAA